MNIQHDRDDFDPLKLFKWLAAHIEQPEKFAQIFCNAAKSQKIIDHHLKEIIKEILIKDIEMRSHLKEVMREVEKEDWIYFLKKIGIVGWSVVMIIIGIVLNNVSKKYFG